MKLYLGRKRKQRLIFGVATVICGILIWWAQTYEPLREQKNDLSAELQKLSQERDQSIEKLKKLTEFIEKHKAVENDLARFDALKIDGNTIEELSAGTQALIQQFLDKHAIPIKAYKDLPASKWREHPVCTIELQIETGMQGISDLLEYLETLNKVIRIERLTLSYRPTKDTDLQAILQITTLQMEGVKP